MYALAHPRAWGGAGSRGRIHSLRRCAARCYVSVANHHSPNQVAVDFLLDPLTNHHHSVIPPSLLHEPPSLLHESQVGHRSYSHCKPCAPHEGPLLHSRNTGTRQCTRVHLRVPVNRAPAFQFRIGISTCCRCNPIGVVTSDT